MILFNSHNHHDSLNLNTINITPHRLTQLEKASIKASLWDGINVNKYPKITLPKRQNNIMIREFLKVNCLTFTLLSSFKFFPQDKNPYIWNGEKRKK